MPVTVLNKSLSTKAKITKLLEELSTAIQDRIPGKGYVGVEALEEAKKYGDKALISKVAKELIRYYGDVCSDFRLSGDVCKEAISIFSGNNQAEIEERAEFYRRYAISLDYLGEMIKAKESYDESISLLEKLPKISDEGVLTLARSLFNESIIYGNLQLNNLAQEYLDRAYILFEKANCSSGLVRSYISIGVRHYQRKELELSLEYYNLAAKLALETNDFPPYGVAMGNIATVQSELGNFDLAIETLDKVREVVVKNNNKHFQVSYFQQTGGIYLLKGDFETALMWFKKAEQLLLEIGKKLDKHELNKNIAETLHHLNRHEEAYEYLMRFIKQKDELHEYNKQAAVSDVMLRFKYEEGKKEQELLKKKNAEIEEYVRKLEISNNELKQFAHVASHDLKEPLRMITNYAQLLRRSYGDSMNIQQAEYLHYLNDGARRMMNLINDILQLSKINVGVSIDQVDLNAVLQEIHTILQPELELKNATVNYSEMPVVKADKTQIHQLFLNLIGNGLKYNRSPQPTVQIQSYEKEAFYLFEVEDNGIGIPPEYREKVFIIFQRLHSRNEFEGTGIGLAICKKIVDNLNGRIWIEDSQLGGTKFCFTIPRQI